MIPLSRLIGSKWWSDYQNRTVGLIYGRLKLSRCIWWTKNATEIFWRKFLRRRLCSSVLFCTIRVKKKQEEARPGVGRRWKRSEKRDSDSAWALGLRFSSTRAQSSKIFSIFFDSSPTLDDFRLSRINGVLRIGIGLDVCDFTSWYFNQPQVSSIGKLRNGNKIINS